MKTEARGRLVDDDRIEVPSDFECDTIELRWGKESGWRPYLHSGRFLVHVVHDSELRLSDADWDETGRITFNSAKHGHIVRGRGIAALMARFRVAKKNPDSVLPFRPA